MPDTQSKRRYDAEKTKLISLKLNRKTDADILAAVENSPSTQGEIKRLLRIALTEK